MQWMSVHFLRSSFLCLSSNISRCSALLRAAVCWLRRADRFSSFFSRACLTREWTSSNSLSFSLCPLSASSLCLALNSLISNFSLLFSSSVDTSLQNTHTESHGVLLTPANCLKLADVFLVPFALFAKLS